MECTPLFLFHTHQNLSVMTCRRNARFPESGKFHPPFHFTPHLRSLPYCKNYMPRKIQLRRSPKWIPPFLFPFPLLSPTRLAPKNVPLQKYNSIPPSFLIPYSQFTLATVPPKSSPPNLTLYFCPFEIENHLPPKRHWRLPFEIDSSLRSKYENPHPET